MQRHRRTCARPNRNYYTPFTFTRVGPSVLALTASTARSRGQVGKCMARARRRGGKLGRHPGGPRSASQAGRRAGGQADRRTGSHRRAGGQINVT